MTSAVEGLERWATFYETMGCSAAALVGVQFVVATLLADARDRAGAQGLKAFGTPTAYQFSIALAVAGAMAAPWATLVGPAAIAGLVGAGGIAHVLRGLRRARRQSDYKPVLSDWLWYYAVPLGQYGCLLVAAALVLLDRATGFDLTLIAAFTLTSLLTGIRNSWDSMTYLVTSARRDG